MVESKAGGSIPSTGTHTQHVKSTKQITKSWARSLNSDITYSPKQLQKQTQTCQPGDYSGTLIPKQEQKSDKQINTQCQKVPNQY